jgi:hypothetical protein
VPAREHDGQKLKAGDGNQTPTTGHHERATCLARQKPRTRVRWMRIGTEDLCANFTALPNRTSMA